MNLIIESDEFTFKYYDNLIFENFISVNFERNLIFLL